MQEWAVMYALQVLAEKILAGLLVTPAWDLNWNEGQLSLSLTVL